MSEAATFIQDLAVIMIAAAVSGLACKKIGLSPIVGYLLAGIAVGPNTPSYLGAVADVARVNLFAELGMVFLMFGIGLSFSLRRLRQLGVTVVLAAFGTAFIVFTVARMVAPALGFDGPAALFFAGLFVSSSSAVIGKILAETGSTHDKSSQLALGITLSEDMVAIVMLTLLGSYSAFGGASATRETSSVLQTLGLFAAFVLVLVTVGLLLVPRVLRRLSRDATTELETIFVAGLLLGLSLMVVRAGYSLALGAFLLGAIIAETPQRAHVDRSFGGLRDMFGAIFFVAIGMSIDVRSMPATAVPIIVSTAIAVLVRSLGASAVLLLLGYDTRTAVRAGVIVTPLGEFGFIIARMGIDAGVVSETLLGAAVGAALFTTLSTPLLARHGERIAAAAERIRIPLFAPALALHRRLLESVQRQSESSILWRLSKKRLVQIGVEVALVTAALIFAEPLIAWIVSRVGPQVVPNVTTAVVCWSALGFLLLIPLIAVWRNVQALAMIVADFLSHQGPALERARGVVTNGLRTLAITALVLWFWNFLPAGGGLWTTAGVITVLILVALLLWRRLNYWHSTMEISLNSTLAEEPKKATHGLIDRYSPWGLHIGEVVLPDRFAWAGRSIGEVGIRKRFGCSVIGIERHGFNLANPGPAAHLFPGDRMLLLGSREQFDMIREEIGRAAPAATDDDTFLNLTLEPVEILPGSSAAGQTLAALNWPRLIGIQVVGHERAGARTITPAGDLVLEVGDQLLVLGTPQQFSLLRRQVTPAAGASH
ncbi:MAG: cation:proton antiporter [Opitutaceae bacterium]|nr:cation:proton antiporter [Opitutaceae bacterium]